MNTRVEDSFPKMQYVYYYNVDVIMEEVRLLEYLVDAAVPYQG